MWSRRSLFGLSLSLKVSPAPGAALQLLFGSGGGTSVRDRLRGARVDTVNRVRAVAVGAGAFVVGLSLGLAAFAAWVASEDGRAWATLRAEAAISDAIAGRLRLGNITSIDLDEITIDRAVLEGPNGQRVLIARNVRVEPDWFGFLRGQIAADRVRVQSGRVWLRFDDDGALSLGEALRSVERSDDALPANAIRIDRLSFAHARAFLDLPSVPPTEVRDVSGQATVAIERGRGPRIDVRNLAGTLRVAAPLPLTERFARGRVRYVEGAQERVVVDLPGRMGGAPARLEVAVHGRDDAFRVHLAISTPDRPALLAAMPAIAQAPVLAAHDTYTFALREDERLASRRTRATAER